MNGRRDRLVVLERGAPDRALTAHAASPHGTPRAARARPRPPPSCDPTTAPTRRARARAACPSRAVATCRRPPRRRGPHRAGRWWARAPCGGPCRGPGARGRVPAGTGRTGRAAGRAVRAADPAARRGRRRGCSHRPASTSTASSGHRAFTSRTVESRNTAACFGVTGPSRCRSPRSRSTGPSSLSSARSRFPTWLAGQRGMRRTTGGDVSGSSSSPACSAASRNGISYMWVAWQPGHQRRYGSVTSAVIRVDSVALDHAARRRPHASSGTPWRARRGRGCRRPPAEPTR